MHKLMTIVYTPPTLIAYGLLKLHIQRSKVKQSS